MRMIRVFHMHTNLRSLSFAIIFYFMFRNLVNLPPYAKLQACIPCAPKIRRLSFDARKMECDTSYMRIGQKVLFFWVFFFG